MINKYALTTFVSELSKSIPTGRILLNEPMSEHTTFAVGGPADVLVLPESVKEMSLAIRAARRLDLVVTVLGGGSNVLVRDGGIHSYVHRCGECGQRVYFGAEKLRCDPMGLAPQSQ